MLANRLKIVIHKLIGPEQSGFIPGQGTFDNIIACQQIAHSIENENGILNRMICIIDIEKACDTIEWVTIIATLRRMLFPKNWITWINSCLNSASFSFIVNGHNTSWIKSSRGVRQGNPISPSALSLFLRTLLPFLTKHFSLT